MIRRPPRSTQSRSSAASDVYKRIDPVRLLEGKVDAGPLDVKRSPSVTCRPVGEVFHRLLVRGIAAQVHVQFVALLVLFRDFVSGALRDVVELERGIFGRSDARRILAGGRRLRRGL